VAARLGGNAVIRLLICEDKRVLRAGLVALLSRPTDMLVVAQLGSSEGIVPVTTVTRPDIALIDIDMPGGTPALVNLSEALPACRTLALYDPRDPVHLMQSAAASASALIPKSVSPDVLLATIRRLARDGGSMALNARRAANGIRANPLTPREVAVLRVAAEGIPAAEIAVRLNLSPGTVRNYISRAISKTGTRNRLDAARFADRQGWLLPCTK
jgi:two-component system, NarL family, response regulator DesR